MRFAANNAKTNRLTLEMEPLLVTITQFEHLSLATFSLHLTQLIITINNGLSTSVEGV